MSIKGAKALTWDWEWLQSVDDTAYCYQLSNRQIAFLMSVFMQSTWSTRWFNQPEDFDQVVQFVMDTQQSLLTPRACNPSLTGGGVVNCPLPDGVYWDGENFIIDIKDCDMSIIINQYGCGCGCGGSGVNGGSVTGGRTTFGGGSSAGGGASGSWITENDNTQTYSGNPITQCDFVTGGGLDYIMDQQQEILATIAAGGDDIEVILDGLAGLAPVGTITSEGVDFITSIITDQADNAATLWDDVDFRENVKTAWIRTYQGSNFLNIISRNELLAVGQNVPQIQFVGLYPILARHIFNGTLRILNFAKINQRLQLYAGECIQADYTYYAAAAGIPYTPPSNTSDLPPPLGFNYEWARRWTFLASQDSFATAYNSQWVSGQGFWRSVAPSDRKYNGCSYNHIAAQLSGVIVELNTPMSGTLNQIMISNLTTAQVLYTAINVTDVRIVCPVTLSSVADLDVIAVQIDEWADDSATNPYIVACELYGYGTEPTTGGASI